MSFHHPGMQDSPKRNHLTLQSQRTEAKRPRTTPVWLPRCGSGPRTAGKSLATSARALKTYPAHISLDFNCYLFTFVNKDQSHSGLYMQFGFALEYLASVLLQGSTSTQRLETGRSVCTPSNSKTLCSVWCKCCSQFNSKSLVLGNFC